MDFEDEANRETVMTRDATIHAGRTLGEWESALAGAATIEQAEAAALAIVVLRRGGEPGKLASALHQLGHVQAQRGGLPDASDSWREASGLLRDDLNNPDRHTIFVEVLIDLGGLHCAMQSGDTAEAALLEAVAILRAADSQTARFAWALNLLATARRLMGRNEDALAALYEAETVARSVAHTTRSPTDAAGWAMVLNNIGREELAAGRPEAARATLETCLGITRELAQVSGTPNDLTLHAAVSNRYGHALEDLGQPAAALPCYSETVEIMRSLVGGGRQDLADDLADVEADLKRLREVLAGDQAAPGHDDTDVAQCRRPPQGSSH
jgi:tetratricopeptide (TPR) repeat protein